MTVIDTSALIAILLGEPDAQLFAEALESIEEPVLSAASYVELCLVMKHKKGEQSKNIIDQLISEAGIEIMPVSPQQAKIAFASHVKFPALNYGDTFSYALAKELDAPLLFKGNDFSTTDLKLYPISLM